MESSYIYRPSNLLYTQEKIARYQLGGYHPVNLGDTFKNGRYKICHKLGWGGYSTVWLASDAVDNKWVSVKIMTAGITENSQELECLIALAGHCQRLSAKYIVQLLDRFFHHGPNGHHLCLVFELLGPCVDAVIQDYRDSGEYLEPETILRLSEQLLEAVSFLHESGFAHGDLSGRNVAFSCNRLTNMSQVNLFDILGSPESENLVRTDGKPLDNDLPSLIVKAAEWDDWIDEDEEDIRLLDFGETFHQGLEPKKLAQPGHLKVPETIFMDKFDYRVDLWRAGLMIYSLIFGAIPFQYLGEIDVLVAQMIGFVEELPPEWQQRWDSLASKRTAEILINGERERTKPKLEAKFDERVHDQRLKILFPVIRGLVRFRPADRISASQALDLLKRGASATQESEVRAQSNRPWLS